MTPVEALQAWLALEHEAVWFYPVVGARFETLRPRATDAFATHRATRDAVTARIRTLGDEPAPTRLAYDTGSLGSAQQARAAARGLEARVAAACVALAGVAQGDAKAYAVAHLGRAALAELTWGARPAAFPGLSARG